MLQNKRLLGLNSHLDFFNAQHNLKLLQKVISFVKPEKIQYLIEKGVGRHEFLLYINIDYYMSQIILYEPESHYFRGSANS